MRMLPSGRAMDSLAVFSPSRATVTWMRGHSTGSNESWSRMMPMGALWSASDARTGFHGPNSAAARSSVRYVVVTSQWLARRPGGQCRTLHPPPFRGPVSTAILTCPIHRTKRPNARRTTGTTVLGEFASQRAPLGRAACASYVRRGVRKMPRCSRRHGTELLTLF
jgi:hypothetical protein